MIRINPSNTHSRPELEPHDPSQISIPSARDRDLWLRSMAAPNFCKILQSVVCDSLDQWGFKKGVSTESLLLYLTETWKKAIDDGYKVGVLFVDLTKAFDTVDHAILKTKLSDVGVSGVFHEWIASYLHDRSQYVTVNGARSMLRHIYIGVPQGSLMGPRLFAICQ